MNIEEKFSKLGVENAPGQEDRQQSDGIEVIGGQLEGAPVDFSHGDVDAHAPIPGSLAQFTEGVTKAGNSQAYTEYRGAASIRKETAEKISDFAGVSIDPEENIIITPGTQGALFLAVGSMIAAGDKATIIQPDYFDNRKMIEFFEAEPIPVELNYHETEKGAGLDLDGLEASFKSGVKLFIFSNPNNPTGSIYSKEEIEGIAELAGRYGVTVIADELYSRQVFDGRDYHHLAAEPSMDPEAIISVIGPSKTESLSGYRLGIAFGSKTIIDRMEQLQAIVSLRASGYNQAVLKQWFSEPEGWMAARIQAHQNIRDDLIKILRMAEGVQVRPTEAGSYLFPKLPELKVSIVEFAKILRIQAGVTVTPGTEFGAQFTNSFRINFSQDHDKAVSAIKRVTTLLERYRK
ncbi:pyridoxal phosphate-dependent aminotransferase [Salinicoccus albus]|uniref:pyridoxal phosphate-dependent aminotransferase n=1 Tax=Salinicoccus albus TaxID=418756 RepID=UPI000381E13F|nr:pyridoxal phosphate-dependent aminotransferase [Salinicoccus albus]